MGISLPIDCCSIHLGPLSYIGHHHHWGVATILHVHKGMGEGVLVDSRGTPDINRELAMRISLKSDMVTSVLWFALYTELVLCIFHKNMLQKMK